MFKKRLIEQNDPKHQLNRQPVEIPSTMASSDWNLQVESKALGGKG